MKRDFSNESRLNLLRRTHRAIICRLRGKVFSLLWMFNRHSSTKVIIGKNSRFINSRSISFGKNVSFGDNLRLECFNSNPKNIQIIFGDNISFGDMLHIGAINKVTIGNNVLGASKILIIDHNHGNPKEIEVESNISPAQRQLLSKGEIIIEDNVWIGESCIILANSYISSGCIIPAQSIVKGFVQSNSIYVNNKEK